MRYFQTTSFPAVTSNKTPAAPEQMNVLPLASRCVLEMFIEWKLDLSGAV
jgi:hypothetical protein